MKWFLIVLGGIIMLSLISASDFGYDNPNLPALREQCYSVNVSWNQSLGDTEYLRLDASNDPITNNLEIDDNLIIDNSLLFQTGYGELNASYYIDINTPSLNANNITADYCIADGSYLSNVNVTDIWVNSSGDTMTGDLTAPNIDITYNLDTSTANVSNHLSIGCTTYRYRVQITSNDYTQLNFGAAEDVGGYLTSLTEFCQSNITGS